MNESPASPRLSGFTLALLAFAQFVIAIDYNIVYVALPDIGDKLGFGAQSLQWVVSAYAVAFGGFLLLGGRAVDRIGPRRIFLVAFAVYGLASLAGGLAGAPDVLVAARAVQGFGGALLFPATLTLIFVSFEEGPARTRALAVWGGAGSAGLAAGALLGGLLTNYVGWPWVFLINVPLAVAALLAAPRLLPRDRAQGGARGGFDVSGALIATLGVSLVVFGVVAGPDAGWMSLRGAGAIVAGLAALAVLVGVEARSRSPLMPLRMFGNRSLVTTIAIIFIFMGALSTEYYLLTTYIQKILGYDALQAGLAFLPLGLCSMVGAGRMSTVAVERRGNRVTLAGGMAGIAAGMSVGGSYWALLPGIVGWGLFGGMTFAVMFASAAAGVAPEQQGVASALASTAQQVGAAVGLAALVAVANAGLDLRTERSATSAVVHGLRTAGWVAAAATVVGALIALTLRARPAGGPDTTPGTGNTGSEHDQSERLTT